MKPANNYEKKLKELEEAKAKWRIAALISGGVFAVSIFVLGVSYFRTINHTRSQPSQSAPKTTDFEMDGEIGFRRLYNLDSKSEVDLVSRVISNSEIQTEFYAKGFENRVIGDFSRATKLTPELGQLFSSYMQIRSALEDTIRYHTWEKFEQKR